MIKPPSSTTPLKSIIWVAPRQWERQTGIENSLAPINRNRSPKNCGGEGELIFVAHLIVLPRSQNLCFSRCNTEAKHESRYPNGKEHR